MPKKYYTPLSQTQAREDGSERAQESQGDFFAYLYMARLNVCVVHGLCIPVYPFGYDVE